MRKILILLAAALPVAAQDPSALVGTWEMKTSFQGREIPALLELSLGKEGRLQGVWKSMGREMPLAGVAFADGVLTFERSMGRGQAMKFRAELEGDVLDGAHLRPNGDIVCKGRRVDPAELKDPAREFDLNSMRAAPRDAFQVLDHPEMVPAANAADLGDDQPVIGIEIDGEARAYPVRVMGSHELVNDHCGKEPIAVSW